MHEFLIDKAFESFDNKVYWCYTQSNKVKCFSLFDSTWYNAGRVVTSIEQVELILNQ